MAERLLKVSDKEVLIKFLIVTELTGETEKTLLCQGEEKGMAITIDKFCPATPQCF